jgi:hypothetical protein
MTSTRTRSADAPVALKAHAMTSWRGGLRR